MFEVKTWQQKKRYTSLQIIKELKKANHILKPSKIHYKALQYQERECNANLSPGVSLTTLTLDTTTLEMDTAIKLDRAQLVTLYFKVT